jgi:hypothetical protein
VKLENTAPTQEGFNEALGPYPIQRDHPEGLQLRSGENHSFVTFYCAATCEQAPGETDPETTPLGPDKLGDTTVFTSTPRLLSGESRTYRLGVRTTRGWTGDGVEGVYRLRLEGQATVKPTPVKVSITLPPGMRLVETDVPLTMEGEALVWEGTVGALQDIEVRFERPLLEKMWVRTWDFLTRPLVRIG